MSSLMRSALATAFVAWTCCSAVIASSQPIVNSPVGTFTGNTSISGLQQFLGIRFAKPPVGNLRFANPVPLDPVNPNTTINAQSYGPGCPQAKSFALYNGLSEDCLTLNIVRPQRNSSKLLPVMFFIYGGGDTNGQTIFYNGTALVQHSVSIDHPVLYVAPNYRLGGFGFTSSSDFKAAGISNTGLKDQYLALQWVKSNIKSFGGDPDKVMIFGESAGAANVWAQLHYASVRNETGKYFRAAISESGQAGSPYYPNSFPASTGDAAYRQLLNATNCTTATSSIQCLRSVPYDNLVPLITGYRIANFTIDGEWFTNATLETLLADQYAHVPLIQGTNFDEGAVFFDVDNPPNRTALTDEAATILGQNKTLAGPVIASYFNQSNAELGKEYNADPTAPDSYWKALAFYSDVWMQLGRRAFSRRASNFANVWGYSFKQTPPIQIWNLTYEYPGETAAYQRRIGSAHGSELPYVFGEVTNVPNVTVGDGKVSAQIMSAWIYFTYFLNPNGKGVPHWPKYNSSSSGEVMVFQEQGNLTSKSEKDTVRQTVYNAWNDAVAQLGLPRIY